MTIEEMIKIFGVLDAVLIVAIIVVFREWRKTENLVINLLQDQVKHRSEMITRYNSFEGVLVKLAKILKEG